MIIDHLEQSNLPHTYGDISDLELVEELGLHKIKLLISTLSEFGINQFLANYLAKNSPETIFICSTETPAQAKELYHIGVAYVMLPHYIGGDKILNFIKKSGIDKEAFARYRDKHLLHINKLQTDTSVKDPNTKKHLGESVLRIVKPFKNK